MLFRSGRHPPPPSQSHIRQQSASSHNTPPTQNHPTASVVASDPSFHPKEHVMRMQGRINEHGGLQRNPSSNPSSRFHPNSTVQTSSPSQQNIAIMVGQGSGGGGGTIHGPPNHSVQSETGESVHGDTSSMTSLSPNNIEDLDLMTLQRWADALLRNPTSFEQQQQAINGRNLSN